jgi:hypothetical protein
MKKIMIFSGLIVMLTSLSGCFEKVNPKQESQAAATVDVTDSNSPCEALVADLLAGQHILSGNVTVTNDLTNLYVTFNTTGGWLMTGTQLYVGSIGGLPVNNAGNPKIGNFPYKMSFSPYSTSYTYTIPLSSLGQDQCIVIAAHANVVKLDQDGNIVEEQTAWSAGSQITPGGSWATYSVYCICDNSGSGSGGIGGN